jgi:DNA-binding response OmpR family regulator
MQSECDVQRVLIIHDEILHLYFLAELFKTFDYEVYMAETEDMAKNLLDLQDFQVVITETGYGRTREEALELIAWVKRKNPASRIVVLNGNGESREQPPAGVDAYLRRPVKLAELLDTLKEWRDCGKKADAKDAGEDAS